MYFLLFAVAKLAVTCSVVSEQEADKQQEGGGGGTRRLAAVVAEDGIIAANPLSLPFFFLAPNSSASTLRQGRRLDIWSCHRFTFIHPLVFSSFFFVGGGGGGWGGADPISPALVHYQSRTCHAQLLSVTEN